MIEINRIARRLSPAQRKLALSLMTEMTETGTNQG